MAFQIWGDSRGFVVVAAGMEKTAGAILHVKHFQFGRNAAEIRYSRRRVFVGDDLKPYSPNQDREHPVLRFFHQTWGRHHRPRSFREDRVFWSYVKRQDRSWVNSFDILISMYGPTCGIASNRQPKMHLLWCYTYSIICCTSKRLTVQRSCYEPRRERKCIWLVSL